MITAGWDVLSLSLSYKRRGGRLKRIHRFGGEGVVGLHGDLSVLCSVCSLRCGEASTRVRSLYAPNQRLHWCECVCVCVCVCE